MLRVLCVAVLVPLVATACGDGAGAPEEPTVLRVRLADDWASTDPVVEAIRDFERTHPDVRVQVRAVPFGQIPEDVRTSVEGEQTPPDVAHWHAFAAGARGLAEPLDDLWERHLDPEAFVSGALEDVTWDGTRYGVPLDVNAMVLMLNEEAVTAAGTDLSRPLTFEDVASTARAVTHRPGEQRGIAIADSSWTTFGWARANGGRLVETRDGRTRPTLTDPRTVEAVDFLGGLVERRHAFPPKSGNTSVDAFAHFRGGTTAMHVSGSWDSTTLRRARRDWTLRVVPMPRGPSAAATGAGAAGSVLGGSSLFVPRGAQHRELAFELITHLVEDEYALRYATEEGRLPVRRSVYDHPFFDTPEHRAVVEQLESATPMRLIAFPEAHRAFSLAVQEVLVGREDAGPALERAQQIALEAMTSRTATAGPGAGEPPGTP